MPVRGVQHPHHAPPPHVPTRTPASRTVPPSPA
ncbi:hypothetical protein SFR_6432 [Streptomyces sp. FR-008]|nr:hypothetical protein SFR_6432 [Streptomyces sp. FR-008]